MHQFPKFLAFVWNKDLALSIGGFVKLDYIQDFDGATIAFNMKFKMYLLLEMADRSKVAI
jgi:hypothetical protein